MLTLEFAMGHAAISHPSMKVNRVVAAAARRMSDPSRAIMQDICIKPKALIEMHFLLVYARRGFVHLSAAVRETGW